MISVTGTWFGCKVIVEKLWTRHVSVKVWTVHVDGVDAAVYTHSGVLSQTCQNRQIIAHGPGQCERTLQRMKKVANVRGSCCFSAHKNMIFLDREFRTKDLINRIVFLKAQKQS